MKGKFGDPLIKYENTQVKEFERKKICFGNAHDDFRSKIGIFFANYVHRMNASHGAEIRALI